MATNIEAATAPRHLTAEELAEGLAHICRAPQDRGTVEGIVARPASNLRLCVAEAELSPEGGLAGDRWRTASWLKLPDGGPDPAVQITLMNARCIELVAGTDERETWALAGDNLFVDLDLSVSNLPAGTRLQIGDCVLEVSEEPHTGCAKFKRRFGAAALAFVNSPEGRRLRLRGVHARIVQAGRVTVGDAIARQEG
jgi:MOSC domain-containing protein YiiM